MEGASAFDAAQWALASRLPKAWLGKLSDVNPTLLRKLTVGTVKGAALEVARSLGHCLVDRGEALLDLLLPPSLTPEVLLDEDSEDESCKHTQVPRAILSVVARSLVLRLSRSAVLRVTLVGARDAFDALRLLGARGVRDLLVRAHVAGVQRQDKKLQLTQGLQVVDPKVAVRSAALWAARGALNRCERLFEARRVPGLQRLFGNSAASRALAYLSAAAADDDTEEARRPLDLAAGVSDEIALGPSAATSPQDERDERASEERGEDAAMCVEDPTAFKPTANQHLAEQPSSQKPSPRSRAAEAEFRLIVKNSFIEFAEDAQPKGVRHAYSWPGSAQIEPRSMSDTFTLKFNCIEAQARSTMVQLRNIPIDLSRAMLVSALDAHGFAEKYDFVYLPIDFAHRRGLGYATVSLVSFDDAARLVQAFEGFHDWPAPLPDACRCQPHWGRPGRTYQELVERYRDSRVMHPSVPDEQKPILFAKGCRTAFPPPRRPIRKPRVRHLKPGEFE